MPADLQKQLQTAREELAREQRRRQAAEQDLHLSRLAIAQRQEAERELEASQAELRALTTELMMVEDRERRELAAELHEQIGQVLAACQLKIADLRCEGVEAVSDLLSEAIGRTRALTFELSSPILHELGLQEALMSLCDEILDKYCLDSRFSSNTDWEPGDETLAVFLFRSVREMLFNIVKHAQATHAEVRLDLAGATIRISVRDDGCGCAKMPSLHHESGFGLFNIRQRLHHLGGQMQIDSPATGGCCITLSFPADSAASGNP
jgi:signal transduction histidine kinase